MGGRPQSEGASGQRAGSSGRLAGKVALITGAGAGIGRATALRFAEEGALVAASDRRVAAAAETAELVAAAGGRALGLELDVTRSDSARAAVDAAVARFGGLDILVNNAGITTPGPIATLSEERWDRQLRTGLTSVFLVSKAAWPHLVARGGGSILVTASICAITALPENAAYCAAKAGALMLTKCMALDGARVGIRANCVCPGYVQTDGVEAFYARQPDPEAARAAGSALHPLGRLGTPVEIADAFVYLASDEARWVTGSAHVIDGGFTAGLWEGRSVR